MIKEIVDNNLKQVIYEDVLKDLPEWFGIEESTRHYIDKVVKYKFMALYVGEHAVGFYSLREENKDVLDMYVLGIKKQYHGRGLGSTLQDFVNDYAKTHGYSYVMVLTLSEKHSDKGYALTRDFYHKNGFIDIYQSDKIWDKSNPTQIMIKKL